MFICALAILLVGGTATVLVLRSAGRNGASPRWSPPPGADASAPQSAAAAPFVGWSDPARVGKP